MLNIEAFHAIFVDIYALSHNSFIKVVVIQTLEFITRFFFFFLELFFFFNAVVVVSI